MQSTNECTPLNPQLKLVFTAAHQRAANSLGQWSEDKIELQLNGMLKIPLEKVANQLELGDEISTMVVLVIEGELNGEFILSFDFAGAKQIASLLLGEKPDLMSELTNWEKAALTETGNIICCSYLNAITELIDEELIPSPPHFIQDFGRSVVEQALMPQVMASEHVVIADTRFHSTGMDIDGKVLFVPGPYLLQNIETKCQSLDQLGERK